MSDPVTTTRRSMIDAFEFALKIIVITFPVYAVLFAVLESYLRPSEVPLGVALLAVWLVLLLIWGAVRVVAGRRFRFSVRLMLFAVTLTGLAADLHCDSSSPILHRVKRSLW